MSSTRVQTNFTEDCVRSINNIDEVFNGGNMEEMPYTCMSCNKSVSDIELHLKEKHKMNSFHIVDEADDNQLTSLSGGGVKEVFFDDDVDEVLDGVSLDEFDGSLTEAEYMVIKTEDVKTFFSCKNCSSSFDNFLDLKDHSIVQHDALILRRDCQHCLKMFDSHKKLMEHLKEIRQQSKQIDKLNAGSENDANPKNILRTQIFKQAKDKLTCPDCGKGFRLKSTLVVHRQRMHSQKYSAGQDGKISFWCVECNISFSVLRELRCHRNENHSCHPFTCTDCDTIFPSRGSLNLHNNYHHRVHRCSSCSVAFPGRLALASHVKQHHPGLPIYRADSRFVCEYCSQHFSVRSQLSDHIQSVHLGLVNQCEECGKVLATSETLKVHRLKHRPEKHRTCEHCGRQFYRTGMLTEHIRACHAEALPEDWRRHTTCPYCQTRFTRRESMRRHIEAKHEPKSLRCSYCDRHFTCRRYLVRHENKHHLGKAGP